MRIGYLSRNDPFDKSAWSGIHFSIISNLNISYTVISLGPLRTRYKIIRRIVHWYAGLFERNYIHNQSFIVSKGYARQIKRKIKECKVDVIIAVNARAEVAFLNTEIPIVYISDATFNDLVDYYPSYKNLLSINRNSGNTLENLSLEKATIIFFSSQWASRSAVSAYNVSLSKLFIAYFGPSIRPIKAVMIRNNIDRNQRCKLLLVGTDWYRKGAQVAFETMCYLYHIGIDIELTICGCQPPHELHHSRLTIIPYLSTDKPTDEAIIRKLYSESHLFILPTLSDCTPIVISEACSFGLPIITRNVGGISELVLDNYNGRLLNISADHTEFAYAIKDIWSEPKKYLRMRRACRMAYFEKLNWDTWLNSFSDALDNKLKVLN